MKATKKEKTPLVGFRVVESECIWMKAGVVNFRNCDNAYDCHSCAFDKGMRRAMGLDREADSAVEAPRWVEHLQQRYDGTTRPCRHALTGRVEAPKICTLNYECYHCPYDQMLDDMDLTQEIDAPSCRVVSGYRLAEGYYYHLGHGWARFEHGGRVRVGFDDFAVKLFGPPATLDLPPLGERLMQGRVGWTFGRRKHAAAVLAPVSGTVLAVNHKARAHPEITAEDPYNEGWLFILEPEMPRRNLRRLYYGRESSRWLESEHASLMGMLGPEYERLAATGGTMIPDVFGSHPELGWDRLVNGFLRTGKV